MPRGPKGEWRPADPIARTVHICKIATGEIEETYQPPADRRRPQPPDSRAGGLARAAKLSAEERSAIAKRASDAARRRRGATA